MTEVKPAARHETDLDRLIDILTDATNAVDSIRALAKHCYWICS